MAGKARESWLVSGVGESVAPNAGEQSSPKIGVTYPNKAFGDLVVQQTLSPLADNRRGPPTMAPRGTQPPCDLSAWTRMPPRPSIWIPASSFRGAPTACELRAATAPEGMATGVPSRKSTRPGDEMPQLFAVTGHVSPNDARSSFARTCAAARPSVCDRAQPGGYGQPECG